MTWISFNLPGPFNIGFSIGRRRQPSEDELLEQDNAWHAESIRHNPDRIVMGSNHRPEPWSPKKHLEEKRRREAGLKEQ